MDFETFSKLLAERQEVVDTQLGKRADIFNYGPDYYRGAVDAAHVLGVTMPTDELLQGLLDSATPEEPQAPALRVIK